MTATPERGRFIVLEGIDGAGTTTQAARAVRWLMQRGDEALSTAQPSTGPVGRLLRDYLRGNPGADGSPMTTTPEVIALLFGADRLDHLAGEIEPALARGCHVICDRYVLSSMAYQGVEVDEGFVRQVNALAVRPDLTVFLRVDPAVAMERIHGSRTEREIFETLPFQRQVAARYEQVVASWTAAGEPLLTLNGEAPLDQVTEGLVGGLHELLVG